MISKIRNMGIWSFRCRGGTAGVATLLCLVALTALASCGRKTPPKPVTPEAPPRVTSIQADVEGQTVELRWEIPDRLRKTTPGEYTFVVQREETDAAAAECAECPPANVRSLVRIDPAGAGSWHVEDSRITWKDTLSEGATALRYWIGILGPDESIISLSSPVRILMREPPAALKNVRGAAEPRGILVRWEAPSGKQAPGETSTRFSVERREAGGSWEPASPEPVQGNSFLDTGVLPEGMYEYRVRPFVRVLDARIHGPWTPSEPVKAPPKITPPPPESVWAIPTEKALEIYWTESLVPVEGYHVYRKDGETITRLTVDPIAAPPYADTKAQPNKVYLYAVSAVSADAPHREGLLSKWFEVRNVRFQ
ncbi:MAG: hypothetical protein JG766_2352 [Desulfacinum sp.]|nr:hypothetical protein [Desulfacinum sp.]